ncbi:MAG: DNA repair protein RecO [Gammaproteobacteria bacterium]|jgi:DNA repair protein RecO (recombination protein O)
MTISRIQLEPGYVLHRRPYRESSLLLEVLSRSHGRVGLVARGVRSPKSRQRGDLQPFRPLRLSWSARGDLGTLTGAEPEGTAQALRGSALYSAFYLNELLVRLLARQDPHPVLYLLYERSLDRIAKQPVEPVLRVFEKRLLEEIGYGLLLDFEVEQGEAIQPQRYYDYHLESGPVGVDGADARGFVFSGASLLALAREELDTPDALRDAKRLMRAALNLYLGGRPLRSRELFRQAGI